MLQCCVTPRPSPLLQPIRRRITNINAAHAKDSGRVGSGRGGIDGINVTLRSISARLAGLLLAANGCTGWRREQQQQLCCCCCCSCWTQIALFILAGIARRSSDVKMFFNLLWVGGYCWTAMTPRCPPLPCRTRTSVVSAREARVVVISIRSRFNDRQRHSTPRHATIQASPRLASPRQAGGRAGGRVC